MTNRSALELRPQQLNEVGTHGLQLRFPVPPATRVDGADNREQGVGFDLDLHIAKAERDHERRHLAADFAVHRGGDKLPKLPLKFGIDREMFGRETGIIARHDDTARLGHTLEFGERCLRVLEPLQEIFRPDDIESAVGKRQFKNVGAAKADVSQVLLARALLGEIKVLVTDVDADHFGARKRMCDQPGHRAGTATDIQHAVVRRDRQMAQMGFDFGEPGLQLEPLALTIAVNDVRK